MKKICKKFILTVLCFQSAFATIVHAGNENGLGKTDENQDNKIEITIFALDNVKKIKCNKNITVENVLKSLFSEPFLAISNGSILDPNSIIGDKFSNNDLMVAVPKSLYSPMFMKWFFFSRKN